MSVVFKITAYEKKTRGKKLLLSDYYQIWLRTLEKQKDPEFKKKLWERMWKMEGIFAEAKSHHGLRKARYRGRWKVQTQVYVVSMVQNLKRLASAHLDELVQIYDFWQRVFENQFFQPLNSKNAP
ncbi:MAG: transposase [Bdellovibrionaceae bacterium]|nr:transposase [Pseudobdellovibrionaceae bacterium]